jgi:class 3 adenylate cyclase
MEPHLRYARTTDDVGIAFWKIGKGPVVVEMPLVPYSHIEMEWQNADIRRWYQRLGQGASVVRYDGRGNGLSQRDVSDVSLEAHVADLETVIEQLGPNPVALMGVFHSGPAAVTYAARNPDRVSHLVLWCTYATGADYWRAAQAEGLRALRQADYELFLRTAAHELFGWADDEQAARFAEIMKAAVSQEEADRLIAATRGFDVAAALAGVECPTLVVHCRDLRWLDVSLSRDLAAGIPGARLAVVDGDSPLPAAGEIESGARAIDEFLGLGAPPRPSGGSQPGKFRAVLFTDLVGHTNMMSSLGDERGREVLRDHERMTREVLGSHHGVEIKTLGDGFLTSFASVTDAVQCAIALQRRFDERNSSTEAGDQPPLFVRVGVNAGEPIEEEGDLFGTTVILASRIAAIADGGEILVANAVRELTAGKGFSFDDRGPFSAKGFDEPVRIWAVDWRE